MTRTIKIEQPSTPQPAITIGMDVSDKCSHLAVLDDSGTVVLRDRIATKEPAVRRFFKQFAEARVVIEVGPHSPWLSRLLTELVAEVVVANPRQVGLIHGSHTKNDKVDAEVLARLGRIDPELLHPVQHRREDTQAALAMVRSRDTTVECRTKLVNSVRGQVKAFGGRMPSCTAESFHKHAEVIPEPLRDALTPMMGAIEHLTEQIRHYDRVILDFCTEVYTETALLMQVDGVGPVTALTFILTLEEPGRFRSSRAVGSYLGLRPRQDQSGDSDPQRRITKAGDPLLRRLLVQCAQRQLGAFGKDSDLRRWGLTLSERGGKAAKKRALVAVARKLACLLHMLWTTAVAYEPLYQANRQPEPAEAAK